VKKWYVNELKNQWAKWFPDTNPSLKNHRLRFVVVIFSIFVAVLLFRMLQLTLLDQSFLRHQGDMRHLHMVSTPAVRGMIVDRNHTPLAISIPMPALWVNPRQINRHDPKLNQLAKLAHISEQQLLAKLTQKKDKQFLYLRHGLNPAEVKVFKHLNIDGAFLENNYRRYYPQAETTAQLLGFTNLNDHGQEGLELAYNHWLTGSSGKSQVEQDLLGHVIRYDKTLKAQAPGHTLILSIDNRIQYVSYQALADAVKQFDAVSGSAVVLNVKTGEVLAMANYPSFNPNQSGKQYSAAFKNHAVTDTFEPGSTMKAFSILSALDSGKFTPDTVIDTRPGWLRVGKNWVHDELNYGVLTVTGVLQKSSNVGAAKMTLALPGNHLRDVLSRVGFGQRTTSNFPGEQSGYIIDQSVWRPFTLATLAFGYGISVTTLQLAQAYAVIAHHGQLVPISLIKKNHAIQGKQVINEESANEMLSMLESVVAPGGTGRRARVLGYRVAGKTGTARKVGVHGYDEHKHVGSFVGIAPVSDPRYVVAVVIDEPSPEHYYGGVVASPAFATIMAATLRLQNIAPDALPQNKQENA